MRYVYPTVGLKRYRFPTHVNDLVFDRSEARSSEAFVVVLEPGESPPKHRHDDTEQVFYVLEGRGTLTAGDGDERHAVSPGDVVLVPPGTWHSIRAEGGGLRYLAVDCFVSDRAREEPTWDEHARAMCRRNGWDYEEVVRPGRSPGRQGARLELASRDPHLERHKTRDASDETRATSDGLPAADGAGPKAPGRRNDPRAREPKERER